MRLRRYDVLKRTFDVVAAGLGLAVLGPVMAVVALCVRIALGPPVLFRQRRPGLYGRTFTLIKFRTMRDGIGHDQERLTRFGRLLRSTSLDELPELVNVLKGDMSLVGPRPLLMEYLPLYDEHQKRRHEVLPGITGLAQVSGRNLLTWSERFDIDVDYVERQTFWLDVKILTKTVVQIVRRHGVTTEGGTTMTMFIGNEPLAPSTAEPQPIDLAGVPPTVA